MPRHPLSYRQIKIALLKLQKAQKVMVRVSCRQRCTYHT